MIELNGVSKTYQMGDTTVHALQEVSIKIEPGEFLAIMGPSGSGKSTLMHILGLLDVPDTGSYKLLGREVSGLSENDLALIRNKTVGFVFQQFNLLPRMTAEDQVGLPLIYSTRKFEPSRSQTLLNQIGLGERIEHKPNELSGGQQQRVAIARALATQPTILMADEPTGNLDSASEKEIMQIFTRLNEQGITVIIVTHEPEIAEYVKRVVRMRDGRIVSDEKKSQTTVSVAAAIGEVTSIGFKPGSSSVLRFLRETSAHFRQAQRSLLANKVRTGLSMLGILIGVSSVIAMLALGTGAQESIKKQLSSLGSNMLVLRPGNSRSFGVSLGAGAVTRFTIEDASEIRTNVKSAKHVGATVSGRAQVVFNDKNWSTQVQGASQDYAEMHSSAPVAGRFFTDEDDQQRQRVAVIGMTVVREVFGDVNPIGETIKLNKVSFQVIGILPEKGATGFRDQDDIIVIPVTTAMKRLLGKEYVDSIEIEVAEQNMMDEAQEQIKSIVMQRHHLRADQDDTFQVRNMADIQSALNETTRIMSLLLASIAAISLLVGGIGIMNIMLVSVAERTREIGLRKAVGANRSNILLQFLIEAMVVSIAGGAIGIILGSTIAFTLSHLGNWPAVVSPESVLLSVFFSATIGIVFGLWPARRASMLHPIAALRYE